jgi:hypothetical protein
MWWDSQTFDQTRTTGSGEKLTFLVWHDAFTLDRIVVVARIFFWSEGKESAGVVLLGPGVNQHSRDIHNLIERLTADPHLRAKYQRTLRFPLERHYIAYGAFPEEREILEHLSNARSIAGSPPAP